MLLLFVALLLIVVTAKPWDRPEGLSNEDAFEQFNKFWGKNHSSPQERARRFGLFVKNAMRIAAANAARFHPAAAKFGYTQFSDLDDDEFKGFLGFRPENKKRDEEQIDWSTFFKPRTPTAVPVPKPVSPPPTAPTQTPTKAPTKAPTEGPSTVPTRVPTSAPVLQPTPPPTQPISPPPAPTGLASINWATAGKTTPVKNQGACGSCWAHAAAEVVESVNLIAGKTVPVSSVQHLLDCTGYADGCLGGNPLTALRYVVTNNGLATSADYPYTGKAGACRAVTPNPALDIYTAFRVNTTNEQNIYNALTKAPLSIACYASGGWQNYISGVMEQSQCGYTSATTVDHAIQLVGYGSSSTDGQYWIVRNSWGTGWGENGFIRLRYGVNACGIRTDVVGASLTAVTPSSPGATARLESEQSTGSTNVGAIVGGVVGGVVGIILIIAVVVLAVLYGPKQAERV